MILSCRNITYSYTVEDILKGISFHVNKGEQTAIVGVNGAGKTTLFKILTGQLNPDHGELYIHNDTTVGYLAQSHNYSSDREVYDELYYANEDIILLKNRISEIETALNQTEHPSDDLLHNYHNTLEQFERLDGYSYDSLVKGVLNGLSFEESQYSQVVSTLSGGQKTRLALGKLLIRQPNLLLLDEPTNHLDLDAIRWLEGFLSSYKGTLLIISHDRYFLDKLVSKIVDIEYGKANVYQGNYSTYIEKKEFNQEIQEKHFEQQQKEIKRQEEIVRKLRSYNTEMFIKRAQSREKVLDKMERMDKPMNLRANMNLQLNPKRESGMDVLQVRDLSMAFDLPLFNHLDFNIYKGEKVALIGNNGTGKTTLFKIILGELKAKSGQYRLGNSVEAAYYDQDHSSLNELNSLVEEISDEFPQMEMTNIRNLLASFLFTGDDVFKIISTLSGGEKGRLSLAKLMLSKGNFLLLDEPTNHLDMISKEVLENALRHYSGTIFFISHDRYFINRVATKVLELTPESMTEYLGNYDYFIEKKAQLQKDPDNSTITINSKTKDDWLTQKEQQKELKKLENQLIKLEERIDSIETRISEINEELTKEAVFSSYETSNSYLLEKENLDSELETIMEDWEETHELLEEKKDH